MPPIKKKKKISLVRQLPEVATPGCLLESNTLFQNEPLLGVELLLLLFSLLCNSQLKRLDVAVKALKKKKRNGLIMAAYVCRRMPGKQ